MVSVLKKKTASYWIYSSIVANGSQLTEVGDYEAQTFKFKQMYNRICILFYFCVYLQYESIRLYTYKIRY